MSDFWFRLLGISSYTLLIFLCGLPQIWGNISLYMYSYYFDNDYDNDFGLLNFALLIELFVFFLGFLCYQSFGHKIPIFLIITISVLALILFCFLSSIITNGFLFIFVYNGLIGFFMGFIQTIPFEKGTAFFKENRNKSRFRNFLLFFIGINPFFFNLLAPSFCNPDNEPAFVTDKTYMYFREEVSDNFPGFIRFIGIIYTIIGVFATIGVFLTRNYKENEEIHEILIEPRKSYMEEKVEKSLLKTIFSCDFMKLFCMAVFSSILVEYLIVYYKEIGFVNYNNDKYLSVLGAFAFLFFNIGRVFWKFISKIMNNIFLPLTIVIIIQSLIGFLFKFAATKEGLLFVISCLMLFIGGGQYSLYEKLVKCSFRDNKYRKILMVMVNFAFTVSLLIVIVTHYIFFENIGYNNLIIVMTLLGFLTFIFFL